MELCRCKDCIPNPKDLDTLMYQAIEQVLDIFNIYDITAKEKKKLKECFNEIANDESDEDIQKLTRRTYRKIIKALKISDPEIWEKDELEQYIPKFMKLVKDIKSAIKDVKPFIYRPHRSTLEDSMKEIQEFNSEDEMKINIVNSWHGLISVEDIIIDDENIFSDKRIGWEDSRYVLIKRCGKDNYLEMYGRGQVIGICANTYPKTN